MGSEHGFYPSWYETLVKLADHLVRLAKNTKTIPMFYLSTTKLVCIPIPTTWNTLGDLLIIIRSPYEKEWDM